MKFTDSLAGIDASLIELQTSRLSNTFSRTFMFRNSSLEKISVSDQALIPTIEFACRDPTVSHPRGL